MSEAVTSLVFGQRQAVRHRQIRLKAKVDAGYELMLLLPADVMQIA
jgi:hypothetical protein